MWIVWLEKKILQTLGITLSVLVILITALHFYVVNNAEKLLEDIVVKESDNKLKLRIKNIKFNYFSKKIVLENVQFYSNDSLDLITAYSFNVEHIRLHVKALLPIFTRKELLIDSLYLAAPKIEVIRLKPNLKSTKKNVSIPEEMGRIYNSIINALGLLHVNRFEFDEGQFTLINTLDPSQVPLTIKNLHFHVDNFRIDTGMSQDRFLMSDQMVFRTRNQDILFPDGNHRIAFSRFRINVRRKLIEIDSCTLSGKRWNNSGSNFSVFLDTLKLVNVDFQALYQIELIKADSVFCNNPKFKIELEARSKNKKNIPNLDTIIQQFTGDLLLKYIGVTNASIDFTAYNSGNPSSFTSDNNNFEMEGLTIDRNAKKPVTLDGFSMAIRNYENYLKDSSHVVRFDSILFRKNRVLLSNFSVNSRPYRDNKNIRVQRFILSGLSWSDLLFRKKLKATQATLLNPVIDQTEPDSKKSRARKSIASSLNVINDFMDLEQLQVVNGEVKIKTADQSELVLQNANILITTGELLRKAETTNLEKSINDLKFTKGILKLRNLVFEMENASFTGSNNHLTLGKMNVHDKDQRMSISAHHVILDEVHFNEIENFVSSKGIAWDRANIELNLLDDQTSKKPSSLIFILENIKGKNTMLDINRANGSINTFITGIEIKKITKENKPVFENLIISGNRFSYQSPALEAISDSFYISDHTTSAIHKVNVSQQKNNNLLSVQMPYLELVPDINSFLNNSPDLKDVFIESPVIKIVSNNKTVTNAENKKPLPTIHINQATIDKPRLIINNNVTNSMSQFTWNGINNKLELKQIKTEDKKITIGNLKTDISQVDMIIKKGNSISMGEGRINTLIENIQIQTGDSLTWNATLKEVVAKGFKGDSLGKKPASWQLQTAHITNLDLSSSYLKDIPELLNKNNQFLVTGITGNIKNEKNIFKWHNLSFDRKINTASLDSFFYRPVLEQEAFINASPWQTDYMTLKTKRVELRNIDLDKFIKDSILNMGNLLIEDPFFTSYRDKHPPFNAGIIKPLPSKALMKIKQKFSIDTIYVTGGNVFYSELNDKTNKTGNIPVTRISGDIFPVKNYNISSQDSLRIRLNGYLLDSAWLRLRTRESYYDSLSGFIITLRMRPRSLLYLNEVLEPLASIKIQSGILDTLNMRAIAKEHLSMGEMRMNYHDLKVQFLNNSDEEKKRFLRGLMTFIANSFVIKNKNTKRTGIVYFPRLRDRSFINYYIKIAMSGVASSIGAKKNKRLLRRYQKQLKMKKIPQYDID